MYSEHPDIAARWDKEGKNVVAKKKPVAKKAAAKITASKDGKKVDGKKVDAKAAFMAKIVAKKKAGKK
jgi:hypothetical protein